MSVTGKVEVNRMAIKLKQRLNAASTMSNLLFFRSIKVVSKVIVLKRYPENLAVK